MQLKAALAERPVVITIEGQARTQLAATLMECSSSAWRNGLLVNVSVRYVEGHTDGAYSRQACQTQGKNYQSESCAGLVATIVYRGKTTSHWAWEANFPTPSC